MVDRGRISSIEGDYARVVVSDRSDSVTAPLYVSAGARGAQGEMPRPGAAVVFVEFPDGTGAVLARLEG